MLKNWYAVMLKSL